MGKFIEQYLFNRKEITLIIFLVDIRHSPTSNDRLMYNYIISSGLPCLILANKADKIAITKVDYAVKALQKELNPIETFLLFHFLLKEKYIRMKFGILLITFRIT